MYKILPGNENIEYTHCFFYYGTYSSQYLRLYVSRSTLRLKTEFLQSKSSGIWNCLPQSVVNASSVNSFKNRLDKH